MNVILLYGVKNKTEKKITKITKQKQKKRDVKRSGDMNVSFRDTNR